MRTLGANCRLAVLHGETVLPIPFVLETLRPAWVLEQQEPLLGKGRTAFSAIREEGASGCFVTMLAVSVLPQLLALCLGTKEQTIHVPETRRMFQTDFRLTEDPAGLPSFHLVVDRGVECRRLSDLKVRGFELRGSLDEPVQLHVDVTGVGRITHDNPGSLPPLAEEEPFRFERGDLTLDGLSLDSVYRFSITVETAMVHGANGTLLPGEKTITCRLHAALDDRTARLLDQGTRELVCRFRLFNTVPEPRWTPELVLRCDNLVPVKEQHQTDTPEEVPVLYTFRSRGTLTARLYHPGAPA